MEEEFVEFYQKKESVKDNNEEDNEEFKKI